MAVTILQFLACAQVLHALCEFLRRAFLPSGSAGSGSWKEGGTKGAVAAPCAAAPHTSLYQDRCTWAPTQVRLHGGAWGWMQHGLHGECMPLHMVHEE